MLVLLLCVCSHVWKDDCPSALPNTYHQMQQSSSVRLITATWQRPNAPGILSHTSLDPIQQSCLSVCVRGHAITTVHHQNTERLSTMTHLTLRTLEARGSMPTQRKNDIKRPLSENCKYERLTDLLNFLFAVLLALSVLSCWPFHVSMSLCLCFTVMIISQTLWVRKLTARRAVAMLGRINARGRTSARPLMPGFLRPTSPGTFLPCKKNNNKDYAKWLKHVI